MIYMSLIDSHCHLYALRDVEDAVLHARAAGVTQIVSVSEDHDSMQQTLRLRDAFPDFILPGLGIHPVTVSSMSSAQWKTALSFLRKHAGEAACIGEIGLDFKVAATERDKEKQREALRAQMEVAAEHRLPINLHSRRALRQTMEEAIGFRRDTGLPALLHWFAHSEKLLRRTNAEQVFVSVGPSILFSEEALSLALSIDRRLVLIETDAPVPFGGKPASPAWAAEVADRVIASDPDKKLTREILLENTRRFLGEDREA
jgi:TatD DNase family protein